MKWMEDNSIDLVLTDPPYNIARKNNFQSMWRTWIDFWERDKWFDLFSYIDDVYRLLNKNWSFIVFNDWKNLWDIARYAENLWFVTKDMIRLEKSNPMPRNRDRRYITDYECAIRFTMPKAKRVFNRQHGKYERPKFVASIEKWLHPTQKNKKLMEWLINIHSNEWDKILDPFAWSWTTWLACKEIWRDCILIEKEEKYCNIIRRRLCNTTVSLFQ